MADRDLGSHGTESRGCLTTAAAAMVLATIAPIALIVQRLREWRRGPDVRATIHRTPLTTASGTDICRLDFTLDIPAPAEPGSRRRLTDAIVQIASSLRRTDDVYNLIYRLPSDPEPVVVPLGPQLQELGDRLFLVLSQGALEGRTAVWLTIGRDNTLSEVLDPLSCDPEGAAELEALLAHADVRWSMATEWARVGPSLAIRLVLVVPTDSQKIVSDFLSVLATRVQRSNV